MSDRDKSTPFAPALTLDVAFQTLVCPSCGKDFTRDIKWVLENKGFRVICPRCGDVHVVPELDVVNA